MAGKKIGNRKKHKAQPVVKKKKQTKATSRDYIDKKRMLQEVIKSREQNQMTDELARMFLLLAQRIARKPRFSMYTYKEDMIAYSVMMLVRSWRSFDPEKSSEPFSYFTQCIHHSFLQYINLERKQADIKDEMRITNGQNPSNGFMVDYELELAEGHLSTEQTESEHEQGVIEESLDNFELTQSERTADSQTIHEMQEHLNSFFDDLSDKEYNEEQEE